MKNIITTLILGILCYGVYIGNTASGIILGVLYGILIIIFGISGIILEPKDRDNYSGLKDAYKVIKEQTKLELILFVGVRNLLIVSLFLYTGSIGLLVMLVMSTTLFLLFRDKLIKMFEENNTNV